MNRGLPYFVSNKTPLDRQIRLITLPEFARQFFPVYFNNTSQSHQDKCELCYESVDIFILNVFVNQFRNRCFFSYNFFCSQGCTSCDMSSLQGGVTPTLPGFLCGWNKLQTISLRKNVTKAMTCMNIRLILTCQVNDCECVSNAMALFCFDLGATTISYLNFSLVHISLMYLVKEHAILETSVTMRKSLYNIVLFNMQCAERKHNKVIQCLPRD